MSRIIPVTMSDREIEEFDAYWKRKGFESRADFVRTACREMLLRDHLRRNSE